jgi:glutamyl-tRNA synthetase
MTEPLEKTSSAVRVRFAPSPTGLLHIGGLRTALYNYLFAKRNGGTFLLRIEDTDRSRYQEDAEDDILASLRWAGLEFDEGPGIGGPHEPYYQSKRRPEYERQAMRLVDSGKAYYAFDTPEEIEDMRARLQKAGNPSPRYDAITRMSMRNSITLPDAEVDRLLAEEAPHVVRLRVPRRETIRFEDDIRGWVSFESSGIDDQVLIKSDGMPTYHLANVVDDHEMGITHVIRGEEWLSSTPKHILLYEYFGWDAPKMAHLPLILSPSGGKLSKRNAETLGIPVSVRQYRDAGYEPSALLNFLALLGWNPGDEREVFSLEDLVDAFSLDRVGSSGVQFNLDKLRWFNQQWVRSIGPDHLAGALKNALTQEGLTADDDYLLEVVKLLTDRITFVNDLLPMGRYFFEEPSEYDAQGLSRLSEQAPDLLEALASALEGDHSEFVGSAIEGVVAKTAADLGLKPGKLMFPMRLGVTGMTVGPALYDTMALLGRQRCVARLRAASSAFHESLTTS